MHVVRSFIPIAKDLEDVGLVWQPEIGDEILDRANTNTVSILVDPQGMTPSILRSTYMWLPSVEQLVLQLEARQAVLFHAGLELSEVEICYKTVIQAPLHHIETKAQSLRSSLGIALRDLLLASGVCH
jgi:hypothetical protein